tara:strand:- start:30897 stop:31076 length:180 start_codon:yes stop_codon:yes gene_type:complete
MYFLFHSDYKFSKGSKINPFGLKSLIFKGKKLSCKISLLSDIISDFRIDYPFERMELRW